MATKKKAAAIANRMLQETKKKKPVKKAAVIKSANGSAAPGTNKPAGRLMIPKQERKQAWEHGVEIPCEPAE